MGLFDGFKDRFQLFLCQNFSTGKCFYSPNLFFKVSGFIKGL